MLQLEGKPTRICADLKPPSLGERTRIIFERSTCFLLRLKDVVGWFDFLDPPDYWQREFGVVETKERPIVGTWESLRRIHADDLRSFYQKHYTAENMELMRIGVCRPVDLRRLRYIRKIRYTIFEWVLFFAFFPVLSAVLLRFGSAGFAWLGPYTRQIPWHLVRMGADALDIIVEWGIVLALMSLFPRKVQLYQHEWRIKFWSFRSLVFRWSTLRDVEVCTLWSVLKRGKLATVPLGLSLIRKGLYIRFGANRGIFVRTRNLDETRAQMLHLKRACESCSEDP